MPDRLLAEAEKLLRDMERYFGVPSKDIETSPQDRPGGDSLPSPVSTHPAGGQQADGGAV